LRPSRTLGSQRDRRRVNKQHDRVIVTRNGVPVVVVVSVEELESLEETSRSCPNDLAPVALSASQSSRSPRDRRGHHSERQRRPLKFAKTWRFVRTTGRASRDMDDLAADLRLESLGGIVELRYDEASPRPPRRGRQAAPISISKASELVRLACGVHRVIYRIEGCRRGSSNELSASARGARSIDPRNPHPR